MLGRPVGVAAPELPRRLLLEDSEDFLRWRVWDCLEGSLPMGGGGGGGDIVDGGVAVVSAS